MRRKRASIAAFVAVLIALFVTVWNKREDTAVPAPAPTTLAVPAATPAAPEKPQPAPQKAEVATRSASPLDALASSERAQVERTVALIDRGGPFPYSKDGTVFSNREGRLPSRPRGHYREYTVVTPGASSRGARRVIRGADGETYYTRDHYGTFVRIDE